MAKGWTVVILIMILDVDVTAERRHYNTHCLLKGKRLTTFCASLRSGGRRLAVRKTIEYQIGALPRTPFPAARDFPSRGNERYERKNSESYTSRTISAFAPFGGWRHHIAQWEACHMTQKVNPVPLALYSSPNRAIPKPSARRAVKLKNPWARKGPSILRTFPYTTLLYNPTPTGGHNPRGKAPSPLAPEARPRD